MTDDVDKCIGQYCEYFASGRSGCHKMPYGYNTIPGESTCVKVQPDLLYSFPIAQHSCNVCSFYVDGGCYNYRLSDNAPMKRNKKRVKQRIKEAKKSGVYPHCVGYIERDFMDSIISFSYPGKLSYQELEDLIITRIKNEFDTKLQKIEQDFKDKFQEEEHRHKLEEMELNDKIQRLNSLLSPPEDNRRSYRCNDGLSGLSLDGNLGLALLDFGDEY